MRKLILILALIFIFFIIEFLMFNLGGRWFLPNLTLLLLMFINLWYGIRYGLLAAFCAGFLKDIISPDMFGINIYSFILCMYLTTIIKRYIYHAESGSARLLLIFSIVLSNIFIQYILRSIFASVNLLETLQFILLPEILLTLFVADFTFAQLRKCVQRFSV